MKIPIHPSVGGEMTRFTLYMPVLYKMASEGGRRVTRLAGSDFTALGLKGVTLSRVRLGRRVVGGSVERCVCVCVLNRMSGNVLPAATCMGDHVSLNCPG